MQDTRNRQICIAVSDRAGRPSAVQIGGPRACRGAAPGHGQTYLANQQRIAGNTRPQARQPGTGAVREGSAQLQGLASCGICGRRLAVFYDGPAKSTPGYFCTGTGTGSIGARGTRHLRVGGSAIDAAVTGVFLAALAPAALQACLAAAQQPEDGYDTALDQWRRQLEQARYAAARAERRYRSVDPENRLVARGREPNGRPRWDS